MKTLIFNDTINNTDKLQKELNDLFMSSTCGIYRTAGKMYVQFDRDLSQSDIDSVNNAINNFVEQSALDDLVSILSIETEQGFDLYRRMVADINLNGGLSPSLDESIRLYCGKDDIQTMVISVEDIRCMMKDNFVEFCLRCLNHFMDPNIGFTQEQTDTYSNWLTQQIDDRMKKQGAMQAQIDGTVAAIISAPKGAI